MGVGGIIKGVTATYHMNRLANTIVNGVPQYDFDGAAVLWGNIAIPGHKATRGIDVLNLIYANRNGGKNYYLDTPGVLNALAGTSGLGESEAARQIAN
jgi:hypothetical protein